MVRYDATRRQIMFAEVLGGLIFGGLVGLVYVCAVSAFVVVTHD
jgi:hypothetical protein